MIRRCICFLRARVRKFLLEEYWMEDYIRLGMKVGKDCLIQPGLTVDISHCWLIEIEDEVTIAPQVYLLAHDASTQRITGYTRIGKVHIKRGAFLGARSVIMPGVTVGEQTIIGANSVVTQSIPDRMVAAGNPARIICTIEEYRKKINDLFEHARVFSDEYTLDGHINDARKEEMNLHLKTRTGFVK